MVKELGYSPPRRIRLLTPRRRPPHHRARAAGREVLIEHAPVPVRFLRIRHVAAPLGLRVLQLLIAHHLFGGVFQSIDPPVPHTIAELLLLAPQDLLRQVGGDVRLVGGMSIGDSVLSKMGTRIGV